jgi:predicted membrane channel-forming protein YqfA (hemolysin III family)
LTYDLFGIALSILGIYISGIYYAFWCHSVLRNFYIATIALMFVISMAMQIPRLKIKDNIKIAVFVSWAAFGVIPTIHWYFEMGGSENSMVDIFIPRVVGMYLIIACAFLIYITKIPERWFVGKVDFAGHSHNWWHLFVLAALYYWHNSGMKYLEYRMNYGCSATS